MGDVEIRKSVLRTFLQEEVHSAVLLDSRLQPLNRYQQARAFLEDRHTIGTMKKIGELLANTEDEKVYTLPLSVKVVIDRWLMGRKFGDKLVLMEVQVRQQAHWNQRITFYASKLYSNQLGRGATYRELRGVVGISGSLLGGGINKNE